MAAADPSRLSYFSLPGEVRNQIISLVFAPGEVYIRNPIPERVLIPGGVHNCNPTLKDSEEIRTNAESQPGFQLMATCKQAYDECHSIFYSSNIFHLPATMTFNWSDRLQAKHKAMIKRISVKIGIEELTVDTIDELERRVTPEILNKPILPLTFAIFQTMNIVWQAKMRHIAAWTSLDETTLRSRIRTIVIRHHYDVVANQPQIDTWKGREVGTMKMNVVASIRANIRKVGLEQTLQTLRTTRLAGF